MRGVGWAQRSSAEWARRHSDARWLRSALAFQARSPISEEDSKILKVLQVSRERAGEGTGYGGFGRNQAGGKAQLPLSAASPHVGR